MWKEGEDREVVVGKGRKRRSTRYTVVYSANSTDAACLSCISPLLTATTTTTQYSSPKPVAFSPRKERTSSSFPHSSPSDYYNTYLLLTRCRFQRRGKMGKSCGRKTKGEKKGTEEERTEALQERREEERRGWEIVPT